MRALATIVVVTLAVALVSGQQYQQGGNAYGDEYADYESPRPAHPTPRSYAAAPAPAQRASAPSAPKPTPVAILKQINRHNEDGSYTYGFEGGDGSFKIETKLPTGEVKGKYGFVDDTGKVRVVEYGANKYGFQPSGEGITVAPPTLVDETTNKEGLHNVNTNYQDYSDYQQPAPARPQIRPTPAAPTRSTAPSRRPRSSSTNLNRPRPRRSTHPSRTLGPVSQPIRPPRPPSSPTPPPPRCPRAVRKSATPPDPPPSTRPRHTMSLNPLARSSTLRVPFSSAPHQSLPPGPNLRLAAKAAVSSTNSRETTRFRREALLRFTTSASAITRNEGRARVDESQRGSFFGALYGWRGPR